MNKIAGFSLVEMAMSLVIIGLLIGSLLVPGVEQSTQQKIQLTQQTLEKIKAALLGFAEVNNRLPCPARDLKGQEANFEDEGQQRCEEWDDADGYLPWAVLGVGRYDAWGRPFRYRVDGWFNNGLIDGTGIFNPTTWIAPSTGKGLSHPIGASRAPLLVTNWSGEPLNKAASSYVKVLKTLKYEMEVSELDYPFISNIVAIVFSCGKNGRPDSRLGRGNDIDSRPNSNALCDNPYIQKPTANNPKIYYIQDVYVEDQFDDLLVWLPKNILIARLTAAGKWPPFAIPID
jgi:type II secretory pathway pseudopilin PulG